jgi:hypothetical protein
VINKMERLCFLLLAAVACIVGCIGDMGGRVPVVGHVTIDGAPLAEVYVTFRPDGGEPGNGGFAVTDSDGRFEIYYPDTGEGLVPARYKVTITQPPQLDSAPARPVVNPAKMVAGSANFPAIYSSPENTPLRVLVTTEGSPVKVELSSRSRKR